jgi:heme/copper-type cytochrome/quinol oxidase subunit 3
VEHAPPTGAGVFGMLLFLLSLSVLFASSLIGVIIVRFQADSWRPPGFEGLPAGLWVSTLVILGASVTVHLALRAARCDDRLWLLRWLGVTLGLGLAFMALQAVNWTLLVSEGMTGREDLFGFSFYVLTGLHALHVLGGLIQLGAVTWFASRGRYGAEGHGGVTYSVMYWHFLDGAWVVIFLALLFVL